jgi:hypothetical protein
MEVAPVAAQTRSQVPADLIGDASQAVPDRLTGRLPSSSGLIEYVTKIVG